MDVNKKVIKLIKKFYELEDVFPKEEITKIDDKLSDALGMINERIGCFLDFQDFLYEETHCSCDNIRLLMFKDPDGVHGGVRFSESKDEIHQEFIDHLVAVFKTKIGLIKFCAAINLVEIGIAKRNREEYLEFYNYIKDETRATSKLLESITTEPEKFLEDFAMFYERKIKEMSFSSLEDLEKSTRRLSKRARTFKTEIA